MFPNNLVSEIQSVPVEKFQMEDSMKKDLTFDSGQLHAPVANWCWQLFEKEKKKRQII